ncbi:hypothetical protein ES703_80985 [subsurface metagenome]
MLGKEPSMDDTITSPVLTLRLARVGNSLPSASIYPLIFPFVEIFASSIYL